ncbi:uncharacterized protein LOC131657966 [Vicia villosa]|uniref:uncharacterized protein LOC131657966 n=1 Tax=Vicia villosa TaxID=3911 RepID=UPI00273B428C|nr:uncharacterized protein LOC131657966 [Vicia villosa]
MEDSSNADSPCDGQSVGVILNHTTTELKRDLQPLNIDSISFSDSDASSVVSMKEGCGSPMSSWASDSEIDISVTSCHVMPEESLQDVDLEGNYENQFVRVENNDDGFLWEMDNRSYEELLKKFIEKEEELRVSNFKLQLSEQEIVTLKVQVENSESVINDVHEKLELKEDELYEQKELSDKEIFKLKTRIRECGNQLDDVRGELNLKKGQLDSVHKELKLKNGQLFMLREKLKLDLKHVHLDYESKLNLKNGDLDKMHEELLLKKHQLDNVREELKQKVKELNEQKELSKEEIFKLKTQTKESENQLQNVMEELELKVDQLDNVREELKLKADQLDNVREELKLKAEKLNEEKELSKEEIFKLKTQLTESENQLENVREELSLKKEELQKQTAELDTHIPDCVNKITDLMEQLKISKNEVANLRKELDSKSSMIHQLYCQIKEEKENRAALECNIETLVSIKEESDINHEEELRNLNLTLVDNEVIFSWEREKMDADIDRLSKLRQQLTSKLEEFETRNKELEKKVMLHGAEKSSQNKLHSAEVKLLQNEISCLKKELGQRINDAKAANKESNKVRVEINEANAKVDKLKAEICSRGDQISQMKNHIDELNSSLKELVVHYGTKVNDENKLIMRVVELEKEMSKAAKQAAERVVEKKEAVKHLWNSLEHGWSGYNDF